MGITVKQNGEAKVNKFRFTWLGFTFPWNLEQGAAMFLERGGKFGLVSGCFFNYCFST